MKPDDVVDAFGEKIDTALAEYRELRLAVFNKKREGPLKSRLSEQFARSITLDWENFISDILIAYLLTDSLKYFEDLRARIVGSLKERFGEAVLLRVHFDSKSPLDVDEMARLADPKGFNLTFKRSGDLSSKANSWLPASAAIKFSLGRDNAEFFDFIVALRNQLSHSSASSLAELKARPLNEATNQNLRLITPFRMASYLKQIPAGAAEDRVEIVGNRMKMIAASFRA